MVLFQCLNHFLYQPQVNIPKSPTRHGVTGTLLLGGISFPQESDAKPKCLGQRE
jgi:hypothetical protein